jgi:transcriptional regulator with XRE-family HTH domain
MSKRKIGDSLKELRTLHNYTQEYVAQEVGLSREWYNKLENDQETPTEKTLVKAADLYKISVEDIKNFDSKAIFSNVVSGTHNNLNQGYNFYQSEQISKSKDETIESLKAFNKELLEEVKFLKSELKKKK